MLFNLALRRGLLRAPECQGFSLCFNDFCNNRVNYFLMFREEQSLCIVRNAVHG